MSRLKIKTLEVAGFHSAMCALHLPFGKGNASDSSATFWHGGFFESQSHCDIVEHDLKLLQALIHGGDEHAKVIRGIVAYAEIDAPIWFYRELETYRIGRERLASESTMHIDCKGLKGEELEKAKDKIPSGKIQKTVDMFSYQTLRRIYFQRRHHRLPIWREFCKWIETLPYWSELITSGERVE